MHMNNSHHSNSRSFDPFDETEAEAEADSSDMNMQMQMQNMESMEMSPPMEQPRKSMKTSLNQSVNDMKDTRDQAEFDAGGGIIEGEGRD